MSKSRQRKKRVEKYVDEVLSEQRIASIAERQALQRHVDDLRDGGQRGLVFDWEIADCCCDWFDLLTFSKGTAAGEPFDLLDFQETIVSLLTGWRSEETGLRRFRRAFISMGRGNGKSPLAAGLATMLWLNDIPHQPGAEVACAATKRQQAHDYV